MAVPKLTNGMYIVIDPSAEHNAYVYLELKNNKYAIIHNAGLIWVKSEWNRGQRFLYMLQCFDFILNNLKIKSVITEKYFLAVSRFGVGVAVVPIVNGLLEMACARHNLNYLEVPPPSWRTILGIKPNKDKNNKRDYKTPTKQYVKKYLNVPDQIPSNITMKLRNSPHDLFDVLAISLALCKQSNYDIIKLANENVFQPDELLQNFNNLANKLEDGV